MNFLKRFFVDRSSATQSPAASASVKSPALLQPNRILRGHAGVVRCVDISYEGFNAVSGGDDGTLRFWNIYEGQSLGVVQAGARVEGVCYLEDDTKIFAICSDGVVRLYQIDGLLLAQMDGAGDTQPPIIQCFARIPETRNLIFATSNPSDWQLRFSRNVAPWEHRWNSDLGPIQAIAVSLDRQWFVAGDAGGSMAVWALGEFKPDPLCEVRSGIAVKCLETCGQHIVVGHGDGSVTMWDTKSERLVPDVRNADRYLNEGNDQRSGQLVWAGEPTRVLKGHTKAVSSLAVDGHRALSGSWDNTLRLWDVTEGRCLSVMEGPKSDRAAVLGVALRRGSGRRAVSAHGDGCICVWDISFVS